MRHADCIFMSEDDCPKDNINITCEQCGKHKYYEDIELSARDFVALGDSFTALFNVCNDAFNDRKTGTPMEHVVQAHRVMTSLLSKEDPSTEKKRVYRRLIFYYFSLIIDEFISQEYAEEPFKH